MAPKNTKSTPTKPAKKYSYDRQGIIVRPEDRECMARLEKRWWPNAKLYRPRITDVIRKALEVAEQSGI